VKFSIVDLSAAAPAAEPCCTRRNQGRRIADEAGATAPGNLVEGNKIGTDPSGTRAVPNGLDGVFINNAPGNMIGGTAAGAGNLICGNGSVGIQLFGPGTSGNVIEGNSLGLDSAGRPTLLNRAGGIYVNPGPGNNPIGGTAPGQANHGQTNQQLSISGIRQSKAVSHARSNSSSHRRFGTPKTMRGTVHRRRAH